MRSRFLIAATVLVAAVAVVAVAGAGKTGNGSSTGSALVFVPNPVQSLGDESLTDQKDSDGAVPATAYHAVRLTNLDGSGFLRGDYADVYSSTGDLAFSPTNTFAYTRSDDRFEQVMAYYWMT
jgi:zinc metalloprotease ZmpB